MLKTTEPTNFCKCFETFVAKVTKVEPFSQLSHCSSKDLDFFNVIITLG